MKLHFIAIGGSAMHNLAIALHLKGYTITGSDDEIFDPAKSRLAKYGLLPDKTGWDPDKIDHSIDAIILGMHARLDNPELLKAKELNLTLFSYPEFLYEQSKDKTRIVIGGSHGKTTITSMILHVLHQNRIDCDYMVGAQLEGFEVMVKLTESARIMVIEGDEYLTSPIDRRPKFHLYYPDIGVISGIAWDHINVFPTFENYVEQFEIFARMIPESGTFIYYRDDDEVRKMSEKIPVKNKIPYSVHPYKIINGTTYLLTQNGDFPLEIFGRHNLCNLNAAKAVCHAIGIRDEDFYNAIRTFKGASKRLELIAKSENRIVYKDFAHSPSKLKATIEAVKEQFPDRALVACMELHTFSSLTEDFLKEYQDVMNAAETGIIFFDPKAVEHKKLPPITSEMIYHAFNRNDLEIYHDAPGLKNRLLEISFEKCVFLLMSSGNFGRLKLEEIAKQLTGKAE